MEFEPETPWFTLAQYSACQVIGKMNKLKGMWFSKTDFSIKESRFKILACTLLLSSHFIQRLVNARCSGSASKWVKRSEFCPRVTRSLTLRAQLLHPLNDKACTLLKADLQRHNEFRMRQIPGLATPSISGVLCIGRALFSLLKIYTVANNHNFVVRLTAFGFFFFMPLCNGYLSRA